MARLGPPPGSDTGRGWLVWRAYSALGYVRRLNAAEDDPKIAPALAALTASERDWVRKMWSDEIVVHGCMNEVIERRFGPIIEPEESRVELEVVK